jgi:HAMP domain-containing protein
MSNGKDKTKIIVGISAIVASIVTLFSWFWRLKHRNKISLVLVIIMTTISLGLWIWYANLPSFQDTEKSFNQIEQSWDTVTKGDLK